ncbi:MAG: ribosome silencing factor [Planctomycetota bacterium]
MAESPDQPETAPRSEPGLPGVERHGGTRAASPEQEARARAFAIDAARCLHDDKCTDILVLDLRGRSQITDFFVIASGTSDRQMRASGQHIDDLGREQQFTLHRDNLREPDATWLVLDFVDVVVHVFEPQTRLFYDLEMLWGDAERLDWSRPGESMPAVTADPSRNRAGLRPDDELPGLS